MKVLILGGTTEASAIARALAGNGRFEAIMSLAGRTTRPLPQPIPCRVGGFGGVAGLVRYLQEQGTACLVDATHPFAAVMTRHAAEAARQAGVKLLVVCRPQWEIPDGWKEVANMREAAAALGRAPRRVLLTVGQLELAPFVATPWHRYVIRSIENPPATLLPPGAAVIAGRGPFDEAEERALMQSRGIEVMVTKNSGGTATRAKLDAAWALGLEVIMVARPALPTCVEVVETAEAAIAWLEAQAGTLRGV